MKTFYNQPEAIKAIKNVAIYARLSRDNDNDNDLEKHLLAMRDCCKHYGWNAVEYHEVGSGESIIDRPVIQRLLNEVKESVFDAVVVFEYDRLGRGSGTDQDTIKYTFRNSDTLVVVVNSFQILDPNNERDEDSIAWKGFIAHQEYRTITKRLASGRRIALQMGRWAIGTAPYGYNYDAKLKGLIPNKEQSEVYKKVIVKNYLDGKSTYDIASILNKKNILSPRKVQWNNQTVRNLLRSEVYLGHIVYNKSEGVRPSQTKSATKKPFKYKDKDDWIKIENCHPAIKTMEEHNEILRMLSNKSRYNKNGVNALTGLIKCFNCSSTLAIQKDGQKLFVKKCNNCSECKGGDIEVVNDAILKSLLVIKNNLKNINSSHSNEEEKSKMLLEIQELNDQIIIQRKAIARIEKAYEEEIYSAEKMKEKTKSRQIEIVNIECEIIQKTKQLKNISQNSIKDKLKKIEDFHNQITNTRDSKTMNSIYKSILDSVIWERTEWYDVKITVNFL